MSRPSTDPALDPLTLDEDTVERLLAGDLPPDQAPPGYAGVAALLAATVAAPSPEELAGRTAALAELKAVTRTRQAPRARRAGKPARRRRAGLAVVVVVGALATGGAAAAATGHLPGPIRDATRSILTTVRVTTPAPPTDPGGQPVGSTGNAGAGGPGTDGQSGRAADAADPRSGPTVATSDVGADKNGLCQAFIAGQGKQQGKKLDAAAFKALADAAGSAGKITTYCQGTQPGNSKPKEQKQPLPRDDQGHGQGGPPPSAGGGNQGHGQGGPPDTGPHSP